MRLFQLSAMFCFVDHEVARERFLMGFLDELGFCRLASLQFVKSNACNDR